MYFIVLAAAAALAAPVVANASAYRLTYEGLATFQGALDDRRPTAATDIVGESVTADLTVLLDLPENEGSSINLRSFGYGTSGNFDDARVVKIEEYDVGIFSADGDSFERLAGYYDTISLSINVDKNGNLARANFYASNQEIFDYYLRPSGLTVTSQFYNARYTGVGEFTLAAVPLPASAPLVAMGVAALGWASRRRT